MAEQQQPKFRIQDNSSIIETYANKCLGAVFDGSAVNLTFGSARRGWNFNLIFAMQLQLHLRSETFGESLRGDALGCAAAGVTVRLAYGRWTAAGYPQESGLSAVG